MPYNILKPLKPFIVLSMLLTHPILGLQLNFWGVFELVEETFQNLFSKSIRLQKNVSKVLINNVEMPMRLSTKESFFSLKGSIRVLEERKQT